MLEGTDLLGKTCSSCFFIPRKVSRRIGANTRPRLSLRSKASIADFQSIGSAVSGLVAIGSGGSIPFSIPSSAAPSTAASTR